jgi:hypothetical protein
MATLINSTTKTQCVLILEHLQTRSITGIEALKRYGCFRLPDRIADLKQKGHNIEVEMIKQNGKRFASYKLIKTQ